MKPGWEVKALGEVCSFENGDRGINYPGRKAFVPEGIPFINAGHLTDEGIDWQNMNYIPLDHFHRIGSGKIRQGDLLYCLRGSLGKFSHVDIDRLGAIASSLIIIRPRMSVHAGYLGYYLASPIAAEMLEKFENGTAQPNLSGASLAKFQIPLPPLDEQKRIVAVLDAAFEGLSRARAHTETNLKNARELFESQRKSLLATAVDSWKVLTLDQVCKVERGSSPRPIKEFFTESDDGVNWIKIGDTDVGAKYVTSTREKITPEGALRSRRVEIDDFILTNSMTFGRPYIMAIDGYIHDGWFVLRLNEGIQRDFFYHLLSSAVVQEQFQSLAAGAVVKNISGDLVKKAILHIPPYQEQGAIALQLDRAAEVSEQLQSHYRAKLADLDALRQALLQKAFAGDLT